VNLSVPTATGPAGERGLGEASFDSRQIDGVAYDHDVVIDGGEARKHKKKPSKRFREQYGHTVSFSTLRRGVAACLPLAGT
jgi:hypothetical protein